MNSIVADADSSACLKGSILIEKGRVHLGTWWVQYVKWYSLGGLDGDSTSKPLGHSIKLNVLTSKKAITQANKHLKSNDLNF